MPGFLSHKKEMSLSPLSLFPFNIWKMLTDVLKAMVNNLFKENFSKKIKKSINVLTTFSISHKSDIKTFLK